MKRPASVTSREFGVARGGFRQGAVAAVTVI